MAWKQFSRLRMKSLFPVTWVFLSLMSYSEPLLAQPDDTVNQRAEPIRIQFIPANQKEPPINGGGTPPAPEGTGSRGDCIYKEEKPPVSRLVGRTNLDLTVSGHPTFWVYIPYTPEEAPAGEFSLQDEQGINDIYRTSFQLPETPGIVSIRLPETKPPLEKDKSYRWYFELNCSVSELTNVTTPASVTGIVRRVSASVELEAELNAAKTPLERIAAYARHSAWYDALTELAQLRQNQPQNTEIEINWGNLLSDELTGLDPMIIPAPISGAVITNSPPAEKAPSDKDD